MSLNKQSPYLTSTTAVIRAIILLHQVTMRAAFFFSWVLLACSAVALPTQEWLQKRASPYLNSATQKFVVDGTKLPDVDFDVGESYPGLVPISSKANETRELFFWFFPSSNPAATDEIVIW